MEAEMIEDAYSGSQTATLLPRITMRRSGLTSRWLRKVKWIKIMRLFQKARAYVYMNREAEAKRQFEHC
jgi:hypothetical protein